MKLFIFSTGSYDFEQFAIIAEDEREARTLIEEQSPYSNQIDLIEDYPIVREIEPKTLIIIKNGD